MSRIATARKLIVKMYASADLLTMAGWTTWAARVPKGFNLATMLCTGAVTGIGPDGLLFLERAAEAAEEILAQEQIQAAVARGASEEIVSAFVAPFWKAQASPAEGGSWVSLGVPRGTAWLAAARLAGSLVAAGVVPEKLEAALDGLTKGEEFRSPDGHLWRVVKA
jgi:hypothetical protein